MNETGKDGLNCAVSVPREKLETLLRVALEQWPFKSAEDREHERRLIARDLDALDRAN